MSGAREAQGRKAAAVKDVSPTRSASAIARSLKKRRNDQVMSGANVSPTGRNDQVMSGANVSPTGRNDQVMKRKQDAGFSLAALIVFLTAASIFIAAAVPAYQTQAKREREEELIFRGEEYMRAIQKFQRKFQILPPTIDALVETNGLRFIRRPYKDPITGEDFRLIGVNPDGSITGSVIATQGTGTTPLFADTQRFGAGSGQQPQSGTSQQQGQEPRAGSGAAGQTPQQPGGLPQQQQSGFPPQQRLNPGAGGAGLSGQVPQPGLQRQQQQQPGLPNTGLSGIIGVASNSKEPSLKVYNKHEKYNEWEFVAILGQPGQPGQPPGGGGAPGAGGQPPAGPGQPGQPFNPGTGQFPGGQGFNPFTGQSNGGQGQSPFNPATGQLPGQSGQQPVGFGNQQGVQPGPPVNKRP